VSAEAEGASPESRARQSHVALDSGPAALRRPGMTAECFFSSLLDFAAVRVTIARIAPTPARKKQNGQTFVQPLWRKALRHSANSEGDDISFEMASEKKNYFFFLPFFFFFIAMVISFG
jgi:hypothetical protein